VRAAFKQFHLLVRHPTAGRTKVDFVAFVCRVLRWEPRVARTPAVC
jgi:hypothetical protein